MDLFVPRKLKFKAWNKDTRLMMRLNTIDYAKGELYKKDHILLQFTGLSDSQGDEIYDMDVLLIGKTKYVVQWSPELNHWLLRSLQDKEEKPFERAAVVKANRLCSYFETLR